MTVSKDQKHELDGLGRKFKTPLEQRIKKSRFANLIKGFNDDQVKLLAYCLLFDPEVKTAIDYYSKAVENGAQLAALKLEFEKRNIHLLKNPRIDKGE